jgi:tRNA-specific 2-thiouridylase
MAKRAVIAMSGGVDSSVAAYLLREAGYEVVGLFMRLGRWGAGQEPASRSCCTTADAGDARRVAEQLGLRFYTLNFQADFDRIVDYFCAEYARGRTPNPCIVCNRDLKFGRLAAFAETLDAAVIATGHYARVDRTGGDVRLRRGLDARKDQSYVLFGIPRTRLAQIEFPLGAMRKEEVRAIAAKVGLAVKDKPESQEICFVPGNDYGDLVRAHAAATGGGLHPGQLLLTDGTVVGKHPGIEFFTVGQRRGLGVAFGRPAYVVRIDPETHAVVLGRQEDLLASELRAANLNWLTDPPGESFHAAVQIRSTHRAASAEVVLEGGRAWVVFDQPQQAVTPGQAAVFYDGDTVLGGGWIQFPLTAARREG